MFFLKKVQWVMLVFGWFSCGFHVIVSFNFIIWPNQFILKSLNLFFNSQCNIYCSWFCSQQYLTCYCPFICSLVRSNLFLSMFLQSVRFNLLLSMFLHWVMFNLLLSMFLQSVIFNLLLLMILQSQQYLTCLSECLIFNWFLSMVL